MNFDSEGFEPAPVQSPFSRVYDHSLPHSGWPPVTWKGSGAHVPLSVQAARAARGYSLTELPTRLQALAGRRRSSPYLWLLPDYTSDSLIGPAGRKREMYLQNLIN
ncbi:unnamed protein product [Spirodela intermedia]|uniref:Uncharacterized protein n=1 Tax=Spirodela intermedia TaxID=51605 RepID=A0ABN7ECX4_SPIIN|nr:unnamed protein product [Spirodela intermedia]